MRSVNLIGDCHSTRIWEHWNPEDCPVDFKVWGVAGMTAWAFDPKKFELEKKESSGIESGNDYCVKPREYWVKSFNEFKNSDIVMLWLGYVDIRQWLPKHQNTEQTVIEYLDRVTEYFKNSTIQLIEPLPQFTEMLLKYEGISPSYSYEERQKINGIFVKTLNDYARDNKMLMPITQEEIKQAVGLSEFTPEDTANWAPHPQDSLKREYWKKIFELFMEKINHIDQKNFHVISPPGSGNTFAENLIVEYLCNSNYKSVHHKYDTFNTDTNNISILRNPYDSIASSVELELNKSLTTPNDKENSRFMNEIKYNTSKVLYPMFDKNIEDYKQFIKALKDQKQENVFISTFEFLTKTPENFLNKISKKFNIKIKNKDLNKIEENVINKMKQDIYLIKRIPKETTSLRELINSNIESYQPMQEIYNQYLEYKTKIEEGKGNE